MNIHMKIFELSQRFYFEAAHTLHRSYETEGSLRIHGHTFEAEVTVSGEPDSTTGMIIDLAQLRGEIERVRSLLDHRFLDEIEEIGPATLENLAIYIYRNIEKNLPRIKSIAVERSKSGDKCILKCTE